MEDQEYIGDGVYVGHDGHQFWLYANHHEFPTDKIALEVEVFTELTNYVKKILLKKQEERDAKD